MDTWLVLSGKTIVEKDNQLKPIDRFLGNDLPEIAKNLRKSINTRVIEKNAWKDSIRFLLYLIFYLFVTAPIYIPFTILLIFNGFLIPILMPIGLFLGQIYIVSAFIASIITVEIRKKPIHNPIIGVFASKEDAYLLAIFVILSIRTTWLLVLVASLVYPSILVVNNYLFQLDPALLIIAQLITVLVPLLIILNILNFTKYLLKTLENTGETQVE